MQLILYLRLSICTHFEYRIKGSTMSCTLCVFFDKQDVYLSSQEKKINFLSNSYFQNVEDQYFWLEITNTFVHQLVLHILCERVV